MNRDELLERLRGIEWTDVEFKEARNAVPRDAYETVSAFSNTEGGYLVFGVRQSGRKFEVVGVLEVDRVQNDFLSAIRSTQKVSRPISARADHVDHEGQHLLVFFIPEVAREAKPLYLDGDIRRSFVRRGGCDQRCSEDELRSLLRDASTERHDGEAQTLDIGTCFDEPTIRWYRRQYSETGSGQLDDLSDRDFLKHWGLVVERDGEPVPTRASILLFGSGSALRQVLPRPVVDIQRIGSDYESERPAERWEERALVEENLMTAWRTILEQFRHLPGTAFAVDPETMQRKDRPPDYLAFREAAVNLLVHQDFGDHTRKGSILFFRDRAVFFNPGDAFATGEELLEPGERQVRNPRIIAAFRRIGLSEQAGTGIREIYATWRRLKRVPPVIVNDRSRKTFELQLLNEELLTERQVLLQSQLGVSLDENGAMVFALAVRREAVSVLDVRGLTGLPTREARAVLNRLVRDVLLEQAGGEESSSYRLAGHLRELLSDPAELGHQVTDQAPGDSASLVTDQALAGEASARRRRILLELTGTQQEIIRLCDVPNSMSALMSALGFSHRTHFRSEHLDPLVEAGLLEQTHPDQPTHPMQAYRLTAAGVALKARRVNDERGEA